MESTGGGGSNTGGAGDTGETGGSDGCTTVAIDVMAGDGDATSVRGRRGAPAACGCAAAVALLLPQQVMGEEGTMFLK